MTQGIQAAIIRDGRATECLAIGALVPKIHHADAVPVYLVVAHELGLEVLCAGGSKRKLLAYPSALPGPLTHGGAYLYARHELLPWNAPIPVFDQEITP